jgi:hypothetical protein
MLDKPCDPPQFSHRLKFGPAHLCYCTNIHPAETWAETREMLDSHVLAVRDLVCPGQPFGIGLRLSALAAREALHGDHLARFKDWLDEQHAYIFTLNGFPFGNFHGTCVKKQAFRPDWSHRARLDYTKDLFRILAALSKKDTGASVSTLPVSHQSFGVDEKRAMSQLLGLALWLEELAVESGCDLHLGLEPEPFGHIEDTAGTLGFFGRLHEAAGEEGAVVGRRIGVNYDACHFALQDEDAGASLGALVAGGIRISKIQLSAALAVDLPGEEAMEALRGFDEPVYSHQVVARDGAGGVRRFEDLADFLAAGDLGLVEARVHFHIPLDARPVPPLRSTSGHAWEVLGWGMRHPEVCRHYEIETYTWEVLPPGMRRAVERQIAAEYRWVLGAAGAADV